MNIKISFITTTTANNTIINWATVSTGKIEVIELN